MLLLILKILQMSKFVQDMVRYQLLNKRLHFISITVMTFEGPQWLSGRVLDSRTRGRGFEPHRRH